MSERLLRNPNPFADGPDAGNQKAEGRRQKAGSVAVRNCYEPGIVGIELRSIDRDPTVGPDENLLATARIIEQTVAWLSAPDTAKICLSGKGKPYSLETVMSAERLESSTPDALGAELRAAVSILWDAFTIGADRLTVPVIERAALPLLKWNDRTHVSDDASPRIESAQRRYRAELAHIAQEFERTPDEPSARSARGRVGKAVQAFIAETSLDDFF